MSKKKENPQDLEKYREEINKVDENILNLLNERAKIVLNIGEIKKSLKLDVFQPQREIEIIEKMKSKNKLLKPNGIEAIWKEIMGACKDIQGSILKIGYLGPKGTFTHQASLEYFSKAGSKFIPCKNISEIFEAIEKDKLDFGVLPIENSLEGTVRDTLDLLIEKNLFIYGELELRIVQNLISTKNSEITKINKIYSHPQALAQTRSWIKANLPSAELVNTASTSAAVKEVADKNDDTIAAIGTEFANTVYGLKIISAKIEDDTSNHTRFLVISKKENPIKKGVKKKTSIVYVTKHTPGALYQVLRLFAEGGINLTKIESRPRRGMKWEYIFLMDFEGDKNDSRIIDVLKKMEESVIWYKILGSYPF